jgi:2-polyprenyl-3-methyl-5-hydroxy-6-metoxy-1,4-benzoquinol methylase
MGENVKICRLCKNEITNPPSLSMTPFPKAAQYYPEEKEFSDDLGIVLEVYQCSCCNLIQLCSTSVDYYKEVITAASFSEDSKAFRLKEFCALVEQFNLQGKKAIEVGCGKGPMLDILTQAGLQVFGLEFSPEFTEYAKSCGRNVIEGYLNDLDAEYNSKFDVFISLNYIEHQPDTQLFIQNLARITSEEAVGYITAPNVEYLLRTNTLYEFVADHLIYFTQETMCRAFETNGFKVLKSELINNDNDIALIVKKRKIKTISGHDKVAALINSFNNLVNSVHVDGRKVAIWGAGHRTLALIALANPKGIACIVDSADFKQGKFSPVTHLPIISPLEFQNSDIDTIIVMLPGIYPDEVIKTIKKYQRSIKTYKLQDNTIVEV